VWVVLGVSKRWVTDGLMGGGWRWMTRALYLFCLGRRHSSTNHGVTGNASPGVSETRLPGLYSTSELRSRDTNPTIHRENTPSCATEGESHVPPDMPQFELELEPHKS
jgi:hypothetical protein